MAKTPPKKTPDPAPPAASPETASPEEQLERVGDPAPESPDFSADEAELGGQSSVYRWHLSRRVYIDGRRSWETCTSYPAGEGVLTADVIREDWGPGTYFAQLRPAAGSGIGHGAVRKARVFTLAAPRSATVAPVGTSSTTENLLQKMIESQQQGFLQLGKLLADRPVAAGADPAAMLDLAMRMAERMSPPKRGGDGFDLDGVTRLLDFAERVRGGKGWPDLVSDGIETLKPLVGTLVSRLGGDPTPAADANGAAQPTRTNGVQPKIEGPNMSWQIELAKFLRGQTRFLIGKAKSKASPNLYAEVLLDNLPEVVTFPQLLELLKSPGALQKVFDLMPPDDKAAAESERAWFESLLREMVDYLERVIAAEVTGDSAPETSDTPAV